MKAKVIMNTGANAKEDRFPVIDSKRKVNEISQVELVPRFWRSAHFRTITNSMAFYRERLGEAVGEHWTSMDLCFHPTRKFLHSGNSSEITVRRTNHLAAKSLPGLSGSERVSLDSRVE
jgi:hypothetical protein